MSDEADSKTLADWCESMAELCEQFWGSVYNAEQIEARYESERQALDVFNNNARVAAQCAEVYGLTLRTSADLRSLAQRLRSFAERLARQSS